MTKKGKPQEKNRISFDSRTKQHLMAKIDNVQQNNKCGSCGDKDETILFTNPSTRAGYDTRSIFKWSLTGFNSEFSFS